jgi:3',5'-nucleoside bisphosphate phosphatase
MLHYDLHIHSCLSPCSDEDMTPNNIVNMAVLKGLGMIAVADHNTVGNAASVMAAGQRAGLLVVPAMEFCTAEEIHLLCLFPSIEAGKAFEAEACEADGVPLNRPDVFGDQRLMDEQDEWTGTERRMLLAASGYGVDEALRLLSALGGVAVPAHVDRDSFSMTASLGLVPPAYGFRVAEISRRADASAVRRIHPELENVVFLVNSDAHHLWDISDSGQTVRLRERSVQAVISAVREGEGFA